MTTAEKIKIDKLWEFQLYERDKNGNPQPLGARKREIAPMVHFDSRTYNLESGKLYALQRREISLDDNGFATFGAWEWASDWEPTWQLPWRTNGEPEQTNWWSRTFGKLLSRS